MYTVYFLYNDIYEKFEWTLEQCLDYFGYELWNKVKSGKFDRLYHVVDHN